MRNDSGHLARRTLGAVIAYLNLLDEEWEGMSDEECRRSLRLALEAARRPIDRHPEAPEAPPSS